ncbi:MAG TPA: hypothetical protein VG253_05035 [Streptosporangiaceae bacterium]|jgi:cell division septum initiation protein DivIVA|nr:hypothetical protein [Streptosporangiaceae bacterium]
MTEHSDYIPDLDAEDAFEVQMRGYSRRQVNEFVARSRSQARDLEERLSRSLDEVERMRLELSAARQHEAEEKPPHLEVSERMSQILKLADDEAKAQKTRALEEITKQRNDAKQEIERIRGEAREQTERMLAAAQEQAENAIATARSEAEKTRSTARNEADRTVGDAQKKSESAVAAAQAQAKQMLDEATARATAIHDGAERRLNLLVARHTETVRRLTEVRDVVTNLVAGEAARGSLEEEVAKATASAVGGAGQKAQASPVQGRPAAQRPAGSDARRAPVGAPGSAPAQRPGTGSAGVMTDSSAAPTRGGQHASTGQPSASPSGATQAAGTPQGGAAHAGTPQGGGTHSGTSQDGGAPGASPLRPAPTQAARAGAVSDDEGRSQSKPPLR